MDTEKPVIVGPHLDRRKTGAARQVLEFLHPVFVRIFGVNFLALAQRHVDLLSREPPDLRGGFRGSEFATDLGSHCDSNLEYFFESNFFLPTNSKM